MKGRPFLDSNILIYAFSEEERADRAEELLRMGGVISVQVLNEFVNVSLRMNRSWPEIEQSLEQLKTLFPSPVPLTRDTHERAVTLARGHSFAFYDALIVAAAAEAHCETLLTEDMQHERQIGPVRIINPFR